MTELVVMQEPVSVQNLNEERIKSMLAKGLEDTLLNRCKIPFAKRLEGGEILGVKTWISDIITPGYVGCQLILKSSSGNLTMQFPTDWENYSKEEVIKMYDSIKTIDDWYRVQR